MNNFSKKLTSSILLTLLLFTGLVSVPKAETISSENGEINVDEMFEKAVNQYTANIIQDRSTNTNSSEYEEPKFFELTNEDGTKYLVHAFKYENENETQKNNENQYTETYVASLENQYIYPLEETITARNTASNEDWDSSLGVKTYLTLTYDKNPGTNDYLLTNVSGGWYRSDKSITVSDRQVITVCRDMARQYQHTLYNPTSDTFSYDTGYTQYVTGTSDSSILGASTLATLSRGTRSKWKLEFDFTLFNNAAIPSF